MTKALNGICRLFCWLDAHGYKVAAGGKEYQVVGYLGEITVYYGNKKVFDDAVSSDDDFITALALIDCALANTVQQIMQGRV